MIDLYRGILEEFVERQTYAPELQGHFSDGFRVRAFDRSKYMREWRSANPLRAQKRAKKYYLDHQVERLLYQRAYRLKHNADPEWRRKRAAAERARLVRIRSRKAGKGA